MSTIVRMLPESIEGRLIALTAAKDKEATLPVGTIIISAATKARLLSILGLFAPAELVLADATSTSTLATSVKNKAQNLSRMWSSHYYQALNNAIERGVYPPEVRNYFSIPVSSAIVPDMDSEERAKLWGERVKSGETLMIAAGHPPVGFPTEADVTLKVVDFVAKLTAQNVAMTATNTAQEALENLNEETDKVIKKVWDEVETFYNEETPESMRNSARQWGVKYATLGEITQVTFKAERSDTHAAIEGVVFKVESTGRTYTSGPDGIAQLETRIIGADKVKVTHPDFVTQEQDIVIVESEPLNVVFPLVPAP